MRLLVACAVVGVMSTAVAGPAEKKRADKLFDDGRRYLANKEYALACTAFEQSQQADPAIGTQLNIALCYEEWGHVAAALKAFQEAERLAAARHDNRAKAAHKKVEELTPKVPHLTLEVAANADPSTVFLLDGKEAERSVLGGDMILEPGQHTMEVRVPGVPPKTTTITLALGDHKRIPVEVPTPPTVVVHQVVQAPPPAAAPPAPPRDKPRLYAGIGLAAGGGVALGVASYVALIARSDYNTAIAQCPSNTCTTRKAYDDTQAAISNANIASIVAGAGVVLAGVGVYLILTSHGQRAESRVSAAPLVAPGTLGVTFGGSL
ncbi:MAG: hypothetical protein ACM31C_04965 [Acidobacteriota bacterium]